MLNFTKKFFPLLLIAFLLLSLFPAHLILAQAEQSDPATTGGLVQCGKGTAGPETCNLIELLALVKRIVDYAFVLASLVAIGLIIYAGVLMIIGSTKPGQITKAWGILKSVVIGFAIITVAWALVNQVVSFFAAPTGPLHEAIEAVFK